MDMRSIHYSSQLLFVPTERIEPAKVGGRSVELYAELAKSPFPLENVIHGQGSIVKMETKLSEGYRKVAIHPDRLEVEEEWAESSVEEFAEFLDFAAEKFLTVFQLPLFVVQTCFVRSLIPLPANADSRDFLAFNTAHLSVEQLNRLPKPPGRVGLILEFPRDAAAPASQRLVRIESYGREINHIFVENRSVFTQPIDRSNIRLCGVNLTDTHAFIARDIVHFLNLSS